MSDSDGVQCKERRDTKLFLCVLCVLSRPGERVATSKCSRLWVKTEKSLGKSAVWIHSLQNEKSDSPIGHPLGMDWVCAGDFGRGGGADQLQSRCSSDPLGKLLSMPRTGREDAQREVPPRCQGRCGGQRRDCTRKTKGQRTHRPHLYPQRGRPDAAGRIPQD